MRNYSVLMAVLPYAKAYNCRRLRSNLHGQHRQCRTFWHNFTLKGKPSNIDFEHLDNNLAQVDLDGDGTPRASKMESQYQQFIGQQFPLMPGENRLKLCRNIIHTTLSRQKKLNAVDDTELQRYVDYIIDGMNQDQLDALEQMPVKPSTNSISEGQVLSTPYPYDKAKLIVREMAEILMFRLTEKKLVAESITLEVGYDRENVDKGGYRGLTQTDRYGRIIPKAAHGTVRFDAPTNLGSTLINESAKLFERITDPALTVRRITINANKVTPDEGIYQVDFFTDTKKLEKEKKLQQAMLGIKNKYGKNAVLKASSYEEGATMRQRNAQIGGHSAGGSDGKLQK